MEKRVLIIEAENGWSVLDADNGDRIKEGLSRPEEGLQLCEAKDYIAPYRGESGRFFADLSGEALYLTREAKTHDLELEYVDGTPCLDFELCPTCKGPAFGMDHDGHNCYYCPECEKDVDCVPPPEWIGEAD